DETEGDELLNQAVTFQPQAREVLIFDEHVRSTEATEEPFPGLGRTDRFSTAIQAGGIYAVADPTPQLADRVAAWGIDRRTLGLTLDAYSEAVGGGGGIARGIKVSSEATAPQQGPFYALMVQP